VLAEAVHQRDVVLLAPVKRQPHVVEGLRLDHEVDQPAAARHRGDAERVVPVV